MNFKLEILANFELCVCVCVGGGGGGGIKFVNKLFTELHNSFAFQLKVDQEGKTSYF